mgnify:CR=1 FL=1
MKKVILLFIFISLPVFSQINFETGYFIDNNGIKTNCLIRNLDWVNNPSQIEYKINNNEKSKFYTVSDIKEFAVENNCIYKRFNVKIDKTSGNINLLGNDRNPIWSDDTVFLKSIVEGEINLYEYIDSNKVVFFISSGNHESVEQLVYKEYYKENSQIGKNYLFRQQLFNSIKSNNLDIEDFKKINYTKSDIINLLLKYSPNNDLKTKKIEFSKKSIAINFKIISGINFTNFSIIYSPSQKYSFDTQSILTVGFEFECVLPIKKNKWTFFINPNYQSYQAKVVINKDEGYSFYPKEYSLNNRFIEIPVGIRHYLFLKNDTKLFFNAGLTFNYSFNSTLTTQNDEFSIYANSYNRFIGMGLNINKYSFEIRYNSDKDLLREFIFESSKYTSTSILLGYKFL